jgi:acyl-CoA synthetase (AMP-forming)/AMP-acid ligase II
VSGEIWVRAAHLRDGYDALWMTNQASAAHPGWHRTGDVGAVDAEGRLWVQGRMVHVISTATGPVTPVGVEQRVQDRLAEAAANGDDGSPGGGSAPSDAVGRPGVAVVGVGPVGTQQVVVVLTGPGGPLAPTRIAAAARQAAGVDVAAVLVCPALPVDIRHNSKIDRVAVGRWAAGLLAGRGGTTGRSGMPGAAGRAVRR